MKRLLLSLALAAAAFGAQHSVLGTLADFRGGSLEFVLRADGGETLRFHVSPETQVVRIPPGERDLAKAVPAEVTDLSIGDRLLVTFVEGMDEPRRIVRITPTDIEKRNEAERLDWQQRGLSGIVTGKTESEVTIETRTTEGAQTIQLAITPNTKVRRYAPDSVKFADAQPSRIGEIAPGDQLRARGTKSAGGSRVEADDVVFGTFLTLLGPISAVDREAGEIRIQDLKSNTPVTIRVTADSRLKRMPDLKQMFAQMMRAPASGKAKATAPAPPPDMARMLEGLPACAIDDIKPGTTLVATATRGSQPGIVTAILVVSNIDALIQMAQAGDKNLSPVEAISRMHHGAMDSPYGFSLPAMIP